MKLLRSILLLSFCLPLALAAQNTVFNDSFTGDALNPVSYPAVTGTSTGWAVLSNKASPAPTEAGGALTINMASTTSGFVETQALFAPSPVQLLAGTYIELTTTFVPTNVLTSASDNLIFGFFNSGGSAPLSGLLNSGLSSALTTFATGGAKGWLGYNANIPLTGASPRVLNRAAQTAANNTVQDVVVDSQSTSVGYSVPAGTSASSIGAISTTFANGSTYTVDYKLSLSADGLTLTSAVSVYNGTGTTGLGANTLITSSTGKFTGAAILTKAFDALAIGWRADAGAAGNLKLSALTVKTTGGTPWFTTQPPSAIAVSIGSDLNLAAVVGGAVSSYQWQFSTDGGSTFAALDSVANPSAATAALALTNVQNANAGIYRLIATNATGSSASSNCTVTVSAFPVAPTISTNPVGATVLGGTPYTFNVTVNGTSPLSYQWEMSSDGVAFAPVAGATSVAYTISPVSLLDEGFYRVTITNVAGSATSTAAQLVVNQPLTITNQPVGAALNLGSPYTLSATAVGKPAPTYQWNLNGVAISGATNATYTIASAAAANAGIYAVVASNSAGDSVTSSGAAVAVVSSTLATTTLTPTATPTGIAPDTRLTLIFNQPISVGIMGTIKIFDASNPTIPVDTIDLIAGTALMKTLRAASTLSTQALPVQNKTVGGLTNFNYYPITVSGNTATLYPRNKVLTYGKTYFVTIDPGVFTDSTGLSYAGISGSSGWTFSTKAASPSSSATQFVVATDGSGDFYTVQGALDFIPAANTTPRTILIRKGTYFEQIYFTGKHAITLLGEDRAQSMIVYPNNNTFNNVGGSYHRMTVQADKVNNVAFVNLTIQNSTPKGGSQAEALILNGTTTAQGIISNVTLFSYQDTLQVNGQGYVTDSRISGDVDFMWGSGPCFFNNCDITALTSGGYFTQIRNGSAGHGYVFSNCRFTASAGVTGTFLGRIDPTSGGFPNSEVVVLDSKFGDATNNAFLNTTTGVSGANYLAGWWLLNNAANAAAASSVHNWTNSIVNATGAALPNPNADGFTTMPLDATTQANYRSVPWVLGNNWTPSFAPLIATSPVAQVVNVGSGFTLSVQAFGIPALTYQWLLNGVPIAGATGSSYTVASSGVADAGMYSVVVSGGASSVTTKPVSLVIPGAAPVIALQPANTSGLLGTTATLNAWALGSGPFSYQWMKEGVPLAGATNLALRLTGLQASDAGNYSVAVTNAGGTSTTASAALTIVAPATTVPTLPQIPAGIFDVTTFGAVGDGATDNTIAIQAAINAAKAAGGGTVELPPASGAYLCGPITLSSHLNLQVDAGALLRALPFGVYPKSFTVPAHFITITSASTDVEFSGGGTIDGDGTAWWAAYNAGTITSRPRLVQITKASNMLYTGVTLLNSPNFNLAFSGANTNVTLFGVTIKAPGDSPNTDGMDLAGTNFLVQNCAVSVGDDNIVAKPGSVFCTNIYVANCAIGEGHGVSIGGQTNVGLDGMIVTNCTFNGTSSALRFKADPTEGGPVQNVTFSNLTMTNVQYPILFYSYYNLLGSPGATSGSSQITPAKVLTYNATPPTSLALPTIPTWKNVTITNLTVTNASGYSTIWGLPTASGLIANITLNNVNISGGAGLELYDAANIQFTGSNNVGPIVTCNALAITSQPKSVATSVGNNASFSATVVGASGTTNTPATYQWTLNGAPIADGVLADGTIVAGSTTTTLTLNNVHVAEAGAYALVASNNLDGYNVATSSLAANSLPVSATSSAATLTVQPLPASVSLSNLGYVYDGTPKSATATTNPANLPVSFTYAGSPVAPSAAGSYAVVATISDPNYVGTASDTLVITPATPVVSWTTPAPIVYGTALDSTQLNATANTPGTFTYTPAAGTVLNVGANQSLSVSFTPTDTNDFTAAGAATSITVNAAPASVSFVGTTQVYDGAPKSVTVVTNPSGLPFVLTYSGNVTPPTAAGTYSLSATITDPNYIGGGVGTLTINQAPASLSLKGLKQAYDGTPKVVTAVTDPAGLNVTLTYNGSATPPVYPGTYAISAVVDEANYQAASATGTLTITTTALVRHAPVVSGGIDGSVQVLLPENISLGGNSFVSGDLLLPGTPAIQLNGNPTLGGTLEGNGNAAPTNYAVTLSGNALVRYVVRRVDPLALPVVVAPPAPLGTRIVALTTASQSPGDFATLRNLTLSGNAGMVAVPPGTYGNFSANGNSGFILGVVGATEPAVYNLQSLGLNVLPGSAKLQIVGPVVLTLPNSTLLNGVSGSSANPRWLTLRIANGGLTISGNAAFYGDVVAPNGSVILNGNAVLTGTVTADRLTLNGNSLLDQPAE